METGANNLRHVKNILLWWTKGEEFGSFFSSEHTDFIALPFPPAFLARPLLGSLAEFQPQEDHVSMNCHGKGNQVGRTTQRGVRAGSRAWIAFLLVAGLVLVAAVATGSRAGWFDGIFGKSPAEVAKAAGVVETAESVKIPLKSLDSGKALFLQADLRGQQVHYFALRSSDGVYRAAYDTCDVCFRANRGYRQEGDLMVCNNCGQQFPSVKVNEVRGGCNPAPLVRSIEGEYLVIRKADIAAGGPYFVTKRS